MNPENYLKFNSTEEKERALFKNALIFFDTSSLLDFYYFSNDSREEIFSKLFKILNGRLWITSQTEYEFLKNREKVLSKPIDTYKALLHKVKGQDSGHLEAIDEIIKSIKKNIESEIKGQLGTFREKTSKSDKHPFLKGLKFDDLESDIKVLLE